LFHFKNKLLGNKKWILYNNVQWKRLCEKQNELPPTTPQASLHTKKVMLYMWWNWKGVLQYDRLLENRTINSDKYCSQLDRLKATLNKKVSRISQQKMTNFPSGYYKSTFFFFSFLMTRQKLLQLGQEIVIHPLYSPKHCIFRCPFNLYKILLMENNSIPQKTVNGTWNRYLFFAQKDKKFWKDEITKLSLKWQKVVEQNGKYIAQ